MLWQYTFDVEKEDDVEGDRDGEEAQADEGNCLDSAAEMFEIFEKFLLLKRVAIGGFANHLQLIFDALERGILFHDLLAQAMVLSLERGQTMFKRDQIYLGLRLCGGMRTRSEKTADRSADLAIEQRQNSLHDWNDGTEDIDGALHTRGLVARRCRQAPLGKRGGRDTSADVLRGGWGQSSSDSHRQGRSDRARMLCVGS